MNPAFMRDYEATTYALLQRSNETQLTVLCTRLGMSAEDLSRETPGMLASNIWNQIKKLGGERLANLEEIVREQSSKPPPAYWLYISRPEVSRDDPHCLTFLEDLGSQLRRHTGFPEGDLRHLDTGNVEDAGVWSPWSLRAMQKCKVLICLYSKSYFDSLYCGQVLGAFLGRLKAWMEQRFGSNSIPPLIFPVLWEFPADLPTILPKAARDIAFAETDFGSLYREKGLSFILRHAKAGRNEYKQHYDAFLDTFAAILFQAAQSNPLPEDLTVKPLREIPSLFYKSVADNQDNYEDEGAEHAKFVFVAARNNEIGSLRSPDAYGEVSSDWRPFHPLKEYVHDTTYQAAYAANLRPSSIFLDADFLRLLSLADDRNNIILLLVDPWTVRLESYFQYVKQYDSTELPNSTVLVCWNYDHEDTRKLRSALGENLKKAFKRKFLASPHRLRLEIDSMSRFRNELTEALLFKRSQIVDNTAEPKVAQGLPFIRPDNIGVSTQPDVRSAHVVRTAGKEGRHAFSQPLVQAPSGSAQV